MRGVILVVAVACLLRLVFAGGTGLGIDESYMVAAARNFAPSYFDHPLAAWWLELLARGIFGNAAPIIVRLPFVLLSAVSSFALYGLTKRFFGREAGFWAVLAFSLSPVFSLAFGCWVLPDGPLDAALLGFAYALARAAGLNGAARKNYWWAAGFFAGLAMLCKYNALLVLLGGAGFVLTDAPARRQLRGAKPWLAALLALAMFSPVIFWNLAHHFASFSYQGGRATGLRWHPLAPLTILGGEALFVLPWLWLPMAVLLAKALWRGPRQPETWFFACLGVLPIAAFALIGFWSSTKILYHWAAPGYLMLFPLLGRWLAGFAPAWRNAVAAFTALLLAGAAMFITAEEQFLFIPHLDYFFGPGKSPLIQAMNWDSVAPEIPKGVAAVAALRWYDAGKIGYALRGRNIPVTVFGPEPHQFGISGPPADFLGKDLLLLAMPGSETKILAQYAPDFATLDPGPGLVVAVHGNVLLIIPTLIGRDLQNVPK